MMTRIIRAGAILLWAVLLSGCAMIYRPLPPVPLPPEPEVRIPVGIFHIVGSGETLWRIAKAYGIDVDLLMRTNDISDPTQVGVGERLFIPGAREILKIELHRPPILEPTEKLVGKKHTRVKWRYITLHHSATKRGNAEIFDRNHRKRGMGGLAYHFVIGNGTGSGDGQIEVGWRWVRQREINRAQDINICLVGNFNYEQVSRKQFQSLIGLIRILQRQYRIPLRNIRGHKDIKGEITECPGKNFPMWRLRRALR